MRYVFVALLFAAMPGLAFAQPLTFEDALSRAEAAPSVQARSLDVEARRSAAIAAGRLPDPKLGDGDRKSVVWGRSVSFRVDHGGGRLLKKKKAINECT